MSLEGRLTPGFAFTSSGSFHFLILPFMIPASALTCKLQLSLNFRNIVGWNNCAKHSWKMKDLDLWLGELIVGHRHIRRAEIHRARQKLTNAAARSYGLIIDTDIRMQAMIFFEPFRIDRIRESGSRAVDQARACARLTLNARTKQKQTEERTSTCAE